MGNDTDFSGRSTPSEDGHYTQTLQPDVMDTLSTRQLIATSPATLSSTTSVVTNNSSMTTAVAANASQRQVAVLVAVSMLTAFIAVLVLLVVAYKQRRRKRARRADDKPDASDGGFSVRVQGHSGVTANANGHTVEFDAYISRRKDVDGASDENGDFSAYENVQFTGGGKVKKQVCFEASGNGKKSTRLKRLSGRIEKTKQSVMKRVKVRRFPSLTVAIRQTVRFPIAKKKRASVEIENDELSIVSENDAKKWFHDDDNGVYMDMSGKPLGDIDIDSDCGKSMPVKFASRVEIVPKYAELDESGSSSEVYCNVQFSTDVYADMKSVDWAIERARSETLRSEHKSASNREDGLMPPPDEKRRDKLKNSASTFRKRLRRLTFRGSRKTNRVKPGDPVAATETGAKSASLGRNVKLKAHESSRQRTLEAFRFWKNRTSEK